MLRYIQEMPLTKELLEIQNPLATQDQIIDTLAATQQARHDKLILAAANLPSLIKMDTLNQMEQDEINLLAADNDAVRLYELIQDYLDLRGGRAQDRVQKRFAEMAVKSTDSAAALCKAIDLKWYLFKHHALYSHETQAREGMRMIMRMLLSAPERVAQRAALEITMVDSMALPTGGADAWVGSLLASLERYGDIFVSGQSNNNGGLYTMNGPWTGFQDDADYSAVYKHECKRCYFLNCKGEENAEGVCWAYYHGGSEKLAGK
jgi:hypothetical protein